MMAFHLLFTSGGIDQPGTTASDMDVLNWYQCNHNVFMECSLPSVQRRIYILVAGCKRNGFSAGPWLPPNFENLVELIKCHF